MEEPKYELLMDNEEEITTMVAVMDAESSFHHTILARRLVPRDQRPYSMIDFC
jgi:hypothetical protein